MHVLCLTQLYIYFIIIIIIIIMHKMNIIQKLFNLMVTY